MHKRRLIGRVKWAKISRVSKILDTICCSELLPYIFPYLFRRILLENLCFKLEWKSLAIIIIEPYIYSWKAYVLIKIIQTDTYAIMFKSEMRSKRYVHCGRGKIMLVLNYITLSSSMCSVEASKWILNRKQQCLCFSSV